MTVSEAEKMLSAMHDFITETTQVSAQQLYLLELARPLVSEQLLAATDKKLEAAIKTNVSLLSEACMNLQMLGIKLSVVHPESGKMAELKGIGFSTELGAYQAGVLQGKHNFETWPLIDGTQIRIHN